MLAYMIYLTIIFAISYFKRLMWICILIVIAPIVSIMYAFGNQTKQIYSKWLREYIMMVLIQPFHIIVYYTLVSVPLNMLGAGTFEYTAMDTFTEIYALAAISMIKPAERYIMSLFGFNQGLAKMASADEGKKTFNNTVKIVGTVAAGAATAGLGTAAMSALKGGQLISSFSKATKTALGNGNVGQFLGKGIDKFEKGALKVNDKIFKNDTKADIIDSGGASSKYPTQIKNDATTQTQDIANQTQNNNLLSDGVTNNQNEKDVTSINDKTQSLTSEQIINENIVQNQEKNDIPENLEQNEQENIRFIDKDDEQNVVIENDLNSNVETKDEPSKESDTKSEFNDKNNINANNVIINAGNVNMNEQSNNINPEDMKQEGKDSIKIAEEFESVDSEEKQDTNENEDDLLIHKGKDEKKGLKEKTIDSIEGGREKTLNFMKFATGQQGFFDTVKNLNPDSKLGKATSELLDNDLGKALQEFEKNIDVAELHENFNELRDSFDPNANGDWKPTNERLKANQKEKIEGEKYKFVNNEGNKNIMFKIMKEKYFDKLKAQNPNKTDAYIDNMCMEKAKSELKSLSEIYVPLGVSDAQVAYNCEEDRKIYEMSAPDAVRTRMEFEMKFNRDPSVLSKLNNAVGGKSTEVTEKIKDARTYYQEGYRNVDEMAWLDKMKNALNKDPVYVMKVDKELKKKSGRIEYKGTDSAMADTIKQINEHYKKIGSI